MFDMIYINDKTKNLVHFTLEGKGFLEIQAQTLMDGNVIRDISRHFEKMIMEFGKSVAIPIKLLESLKEEDLDHLLINLHTCPKHIFTENFFAIIPPHLMRNYTDRQTLRLYSTFGVNQYAVLIKCEEVNTTHLAAAHHEEFAERFELLDETYDKSA